MINFSILPAVPRPHPRPESVLAHKYLDGLTGFEIGGSVSSPFNIPGCINVDWTDSWNTLPKRIEIELCGGFLPVDVVASGDDLPFEDNSYDFCLTSHVIEHFYDPIKALREWRRVVKPGGIFFIVCPHKDRTFDRDRPVTTIQELYDRHSNPTPPPFETERHWSVWDTQSFLNFVSMLDIPVIEYLDVDEKAGNGFCVVLRNEK